jgi:transposase
VIGPAGTVRVLVATKPVDFRKGAEGLAALVRETMRTDPFSGVVYVFRAKRADRVKLIFWDGSGVVLVAKRLEKWEVPVAGDTGWRDAAERRSASGALGRARLAAGSRAAANRRAGGSKLSKKSASGRSKFSQAIGKHDSISL